LTTISISSHIFYSFVVETGAGGLKQFFWDNHNFPLPAPRTVFRYGHVGYTTKSGIYSSLLLSLLESLAASSSASVVKLEKLRCFLLATSFDGYQLVPALHADTRQGLIVGSSLEIDLDFVRRNQNPDLNLLRNTLYCEARVLYGTALDATIGLPLGVRYVSDHHFRYLQCDLLSFFLSRYSTASKPGSSVRAMVDADQSALLVCLRCLRNTWKSSPVINDAMITACDRSRCQECESTKQLCEACAKRGMPHWHYRLRPCTACINSGTVCEYAVSASMLCDCESGNFSMLRGKTTGKGDHDSVMLPDYIHIAKRLRSFLFNTYLYIDGTFASLTFLRTIRKSCTALAKLVSEHDVRYKDRQDVESLYHLTKPSVISLIRESKYVVESVFPPAWRKWNTASQLHSLVRPISVCSGRGSTSLLCSVAAQLAYYVRSRLN
jgi:hypothetical protein